MNLKTMLKSAAAAAALVTGVGMTQAQAVDEITIVDPETQKNA